MPRRWLPHNRMSRTDTDSLHRLLGELEVEVMELMWARGVGVETRVREIATRLQETRSIAYTTVMTVMGHLAEKGLLTRTPLDRKTHLYRVALTKEEFIQRSSQRMVDALLEGFGDVALAQFVEAVEKVDPSRLEHLLNHLPELRSRKSEPGEPGSESEGHE